MKALTYNVTVPGFLGLQVLGRLNRKYYYQGPLSTVRLVDVPEPVLPGQDWVKIKVRLCGFCGSDLSLILVKGSAMASPFTSFPCIFGHETVGEVVEAGGSVKGLAKGDRVAVNPSLTCEPRGVSPQCPSCAAGRTGSCESYADGGLAPGMFAGICRDVGGGFAQYLVAHKSQVYRVPDSVADESAVLTEPLAVAVQAVLDNMPGESDNVLVIGGGVIGAMIVKAIRGFGTGCSITVVEPSPFSADYVRQAGADHVVSGDLLEAAERITGARVYKPMMGERIAQGGFDRVFDTVGNARTFQKGLIVTAAGGTVSLVGITKTVAFDPTPLWLKLLTVKGCYGYNYNETATGRKHAFEIALDLMDRGRVQVQDMLTHTFPIESYKDLIEVNMNKGEHRAIKTAIRF
ncbi:MAG TPA: alcohol dehydrogenase catalytic domain-containing protein [Deltaproteobacteria bacterium]|nr:alcohol dehydrogenase catalytic domain-containing protein [Deltaproteobacteria bacterium]HOI07751.1 alcohol dehydrogenase catalytic domain-containing protein [Deltaproteobacteria bacterium]